jgi:hypothetical protein
VNVPLFLKIERVFCYYFIKYGIYDLRLYLFSLSILMILSFGRFLLLLFFVFAILGLELKAYSLSHSPALFCEGFFWDRISQIICPGLALNCDPPDICLLSNKDYRLGPLVPSLGLVF